jgi:hypothetical protein
MLVCPATTVTATAAPTGSGSGSTPTVRRGIGRVH